MVKRKTLLVWGLWTGRLAVSGATLGWMGFIFYLSSLSQAEASQPLESPVVSWLGVLRSYAAHIVLYGVLAALAQESIWGWKPDYRFRWVLAATIFAAVYGISDEYHQSLVGLSGSIRRCRCKHHWSIGSSNQLMADPVMATKPNQED